ncbi:MAG: hypothetical protein HQL68_02935 [Magnetococcales bacterium]|nr:hypothetical protein [Magnetococcales bacterium]
MFLRKLAKIFFSDVSSAQLIITAILGAMLGFIPGISQALALVIFLTFLLLIINTNLFLAFLIGLLAKLTLWLMTPAIFYLGRFLLEGPTRELFSGLINAPVFAFFGFEFYTVTGGLLAGLIFGLVVGIIMAKMVLGFRNKMVTLESSSEAFVLFKKKLWVRAVFYCISGGLPKDGFKSLQEKKPSFIRLSGVIVTVILAGGLVASVMFANGPIAALLIKENLEKANGATVDIASLDLELQQGRMTINNLAVTDPNALDKDLFRAQKINVDIHASDLLRKRINLEKVEIVAAANGLQRAKPGILIGPKPEPQSRPEVSSDGEQSGKGLDDYLKDAKIWKQRLSQAKGWLDRLSGIATDENKEKAKDVMSSEKSAVKELDTWLDQQIKTLGYHNVKATHLIQGAPTLQIEKFIADKVTTTALDETLNIHGFNLSTEPHLVTAFPQIIVKSSKKTVDLDLTMSGVSQKGGNNTIKLLVKNLDTDKVVSQLSDSNPILTGGSFNVAINGAIENRGGGAYLNLPLNVTLHNTSLTISGQNSVPVKRFDLPLTLRGPLDNPSIIVDQNGFKEAIKKAGKGVVKQRLKKELDKQIKGQGKKLLDKLEGGGLKLPF